MTKKNAYNEEVSQEANVEATDIPASEQKSEDVNMAEEETAQTDTMSDQEPSALDLVAEWKDKYIRLQAEFDNYRKRTLKEKMELVETGGQEVLKAVLPVVDDVERAVAAMSKSDDLEALKRGVELIAQKFSDTLKQRKVTPIEAKGELFDEELMEAVAKFPAGDEARGRVIDVVQTGYKLGDRVLRFAKVVVGE